MRRSHFSLSVILSAVVVFLAAGTTYAAGACFCNLNGQGATQTGGASDASSCQAVCSALDGYEGYQWATDYNQYPGGLLQCFSTATQCATAGGTWDTAQPSECLPGSHYCYPSDTALYTLQISIPNPSGGETTTVRNYGDYVAAIYKYLIGVAVTIAIVFVMIGGIRYVIGASTGEVGKAKDMITKAITGLVLLLFAYVILYTVNPDLVRLQVPKLPMLRAVSVLDGDDCATVLGLPFGSSPSQISSSVEDASADYGQGAVESKVNGAIVRFSGSAECGTTAEVIQTGGGRGAASGTTCDFAYCSGSGTGCVDLGSKGNVCATCESITAGNDLGVDPSAATCGAFRYPTQNVAGQTVPTAICVYAYDLDLVDIEDSGLSRGACGKLDISCNGLSECWDYNSMRITNDEENGCAAWVSASAPVAGVIGGLGRFDLSTLCASDYCGLAPPGESCSIYRYDATGAAPVCVNGSFDGTGSSRKDNAGNPVSFTSRVWDLISDAGSCQFN